MEKVIQIHYGNGIIHATLLEHVRDGVLKSWAKLRFPDGHEGYMSERWIIPDDHQSSSDTDWRAYLKAHWDTKRNCLRTDCLNDFYDVFRRAAANYQKQNEQDFKQSTAEDHLQHGAHEPRRANEVPNPSGRHRTAPSVPTRDKESVRKTGKQMKQVPYATAEPQPKRKPRYVELSLFD